MPETIDPELLKKLRGNVDPNDIARLMDPSRHSDLALAESIDATRPRLARIVPGEPEAPDLGQPAAAQPTSLGHVGVEPEAKTLPDLGYKQRQRLPTISPGAPAGSSASYASQLEKLQDQQAHPWGTEENHPGRLGKIAHVLSRIGNIAGDVFAPATMSLIPGTELNRETQIHELEPRIAKAQKQESEETERAATTEETKARTAKTQAELAEIGKPKPKEEEWSVVPNVQGPNGEPVQQEKVSGQIRVAPLEGATTKEPKGEHKNDFEQYYAKYLKDNKLPDTAENQLKAHKDYLTEGGKTPTGSWMPLYDKDGNVTGAWNATNGQVRKTPSETLPGTTGQGARISAVAQNRFNTGYMKPATDIEQNYKKFQQAASDFAKDPKTGAATMVAIAQHLGSTFGSVKGAQMGEHMIAEHKDAIGLLDRAQRYIDSLVSGQQLSPDQMKEFGGLIDSTRRISWEITAREAARRGLPVDMVPSDIKLPMKTPGGKAIQISGDRLPEAIKDGLKFP